MSLYMCAELLIESNRIASKSIVYKKIAPSFSDDDDNDKMITMLCVCEREREEDYGDDKRVST